MSGDKPKVLITGGLGNLGSWMTEYFTADEKFEVIVLTKNDRQVKIDRPFTRIFTDITDIDSLRDTLKSHRFDYLIHLASLNETSAPDYAAEALRINSLGTRNIMEIAVQQGVKKVVYFSTFHVYGRDGGFISESDQPKPSNDYAITHLFAEEYVRMFGRTHTVPYFIFRLSNSYGCPREINASKWYLLFNDLCKQAFEKGKIEIRTNGTAMRDFVHMGDVCEAIGKVMQQESFSNEVFNLGSGRSFTLLEIAQYVQSAYRKRFRKELEMVVNENDTRVYPSDLNFSVDKLKQHIDFKPQVRFEEEADKIFTLLAGN